MYMYIKEPISHEVLRGVASRIGAKKDVLITASSVDEPVFFDIPVPQTSLAADSYIPANVSCCGAKPHVLRSKTLWIFG